MVATTSEKKAVILTGLREVDEKLAGAFRSALWV
jgi:hypothetical protein